MRRVGEKKPRVGSITHPGMVIVLRSCHSHDYLADDLACLVRLRYGVDFEQTPIAYCSSPGTPDTGPGQVSLGVFDTPG
jgi:hypothetical protein